MTTLRLLLAGLVLALPLAAGCGDDSSSSDGKGSPDAGGSSPDAGGSGNGGSAPDAGGSGNGGSADAGDATGGGTCDTDEMCDFSCGAGCTVECLGARCTAECPDGDCTLDADFEAVAAYDCAGGGCSFDCDGASDCSIACEGGGCEIGCDGESSCKVSCGEDGDPCMVSCEAGSMASCDNDNCEFSGCEPCDETVIDEGYDPSLDPNDFTTTIDTPLFPLPVGAEWVYESEVEIITVTVLAETYTVAAGIECVVVQDQATDKDGVVIEDTKDYYAQDLDGNVWYMGEDTAEYVNGKVANTRGSWEAGVDGALPGILVYGDVPAVGTEYKQEYYRCEAEDMGQILATGESVSTPAGDFDDCLRTRDFTPLEPAANEHKLYCPGVGLVVTEVAELDADSGTPEEVLTSYTLP